VEIRVQHALTTKLVLNAAYVGNTARTDHIYDIPHTTVGAGTRAPRGTRLPSSRTVLLIRVVLVFGLIDYLGMVWLHYNALQRPLNPVKLARLNRIVGICLWDTRMTLGSVFRLGSHKNEPYTSARGGEDGTIDTDFAPHDREPETTIPSKTSFAHCFRVPTSTYLTPLQCLFQ